MANKKNRQEAILFNGFLIPFLPCFNYWMDGEPGQRTLFIVDEKEKVQISFEEGMKCFDEETNLVGNIGVYSEYRENEKYLHQCKISSIKKRRKHIIFFHMEIEDAEGNIKKCPGQMISSFPENEKESVNSILLRLLKGLAI